MSSPKRFNRDETLAFLKGEVRRGNSQKQFAKGGQALINAAALLNGGDGHGWGRSGDGGGDVASASPTDYISVASLHLNGVEQARRSPVKRPSTSEKLDKRLLLASQKNNLDHNRAAEGDGALPREQFMVGTAIFYRAVLSLQHGKHKGFLAYEWTEPVADLAAAAFAPKVALNAQATAPGDDGTRFELLNALDLTDEKSVTYGDVVYLLAANQYALGSEYNGLVNVSGHRTLNASIVKCRVRGAANLTPAQYSTHIERLDQGRWTILNKDNPIGRRGEIVKHGDRIMLEQEFAYLASPSPSDVFLERTRWGVEEVWSKNPDLDYFNMTEECSWIPHLVQQRSLVRADSRRAALQLAAVNQLGDAVKVRGRAKRALIGRLGDMVDITTEFDRIQGHLQHKLSKQGDDEHLLNLYSSMSQRQFQRKYRSMGAQQLSSSRWHSKEGRPDPEMGKGDVGHPNDNNEDGEALGTAEDTATSSVDSPIGSPKIRDSSPRRRRNSVVGASSPPSVRFSPEQTKMQMVRTASLSQRSTRQRTLAPEGLRSSALHAMHDEYWHHAQAVLVASAAWEEVPAIRRYFGGPREVGRLQAVITIQRFVRRRLNFSGIYKRSMRNSDTAMMMRLMMKRKTEWKEEFLTDLLARRKREAEGQRKRDEEGSYLFAASPSDKEQLARAKKSDSAFIIGAGLPFYKADGAGAEELIEETVATTENEPVAAVASAVPEEGGEVEQLVSMSADAAGAMNFSSGSVEPRAPPSRRQSPQRAPAAAARTGAAAEAETEAATEGNKPSIVPTVPRPGGPMRLSAAAGDTLPLPARPETAPAPRRTGRVTAPVPAYMYPYPVDGRGCRVAAPAQYNEPQLPTIHPTETTATTATATAKELRQQAREQRTKAKTAAAAAAKKRLGVLGKSQLGLPPEVFDDVHVKVSKQTGISFLRIMSLNL